MKKLLCVVALSCFLFACNNEKKEEKKTEETTVQPNDAKPTDPAPVTTPTTSSTDAPTFSDPEVQKFANDYAAFIREYKAAAGNPEKLAKLGRDMQDWSTRSQAIGMKIASNPTELQKWSDWWLAVSKDLYPSTNK